MQIDKIPEELRSLDRWVVWGDGNTQVLQKRPLRPDGSPASTTNPATWSPFSACRDALASHPGRYNGLGFVFADGGYSGVDLDNCIDKSTGEIAVWATWVASMFPGAYAERSPSGTGLKLFCRGVPAQTGKFPGPGSGRVEIYATGRYFTVTAQPLRALTGPIADCSEAFGRLSQAIAAGALDDLESCREAIEGLPDAISGEGGHNATLRAICEVRRRGVTESGMVWALACWWNKNKCSPPWSERELKHKIRSAEKLEPAFTNVERPAGMNGHAEPASAATPSADTVQRFRVYTTTDLESMDLSVNFWIRDLMIDSQPMVIGATSKSLKTSLALSASVSLATGVSFLGKEVPEVKKVLVFSGESGLATIRGVIRRVCNCHGKDPRECQDRLLICDTVPSFDSREHVTEMRKTLRAYQPDLAIIDPAYMALGGEGSDNVFSMGVKFRRLMDACRDLANPVLPCIIHHTGKAARKAKALSLADLAWAGWSEFAGQWWLIARQDEKFDGRTHSLRFQVGSRAGTYADLAVTIDEGNADFGLDGRIWGETVHEWAGVQADTSAERDPESEIRQRLAEFLLEAGGEWVSGKQVRKALGGASEMKWEKFVALRDGNLEANGIEFDAEKGFRFRTI